jgi:hypothetical protein
MKTNTLSLTTSLQRRYLPTLADLVDRMSIVQLKAIHILENRDAYLREMDDIRHDIDLLLAKGAVNAAMLHAVQVIMPTNYYIWSNETKAREGSSEQNHLLRRTHAVNGVRNTAKNVLAREMGERVDLKVDALAADLPADMGNWRIWE